MPVESRRAHMEELFEIVGQTGIQRSSLHLMWDFTVASERNLSERMLSIRDRAFSQLGDDDLADATVQGTAPQFAIDTVTNFAEAEDVEIAREVIGTVTVPCFMTSNCSDNGATFNYAGSPDGLPVQNGTVDVEFICRIPRSAIGGAQVVPARPSLYGHGLLGAATEVRGGNIRAMGNEHNFAFCATDWYRFEHSYPRSDPKARAQKAAFLAVGGALRNPCTTTNLLFPPVLPIALDTGTAIPCYANGYLGP